MEKFLKFNSIDKLTPDSAPLSLGLNRVKDGKIYGFSAKLDGEMPEDGVIFICHGHMMSYGRWLELSKNQLKICNFTAWANPQLSEKVFEHGINIKNFVNVDIVYDSESGEKKITLTTDGAEFSMGGGHFSCCDGEIMAKVENMELSDVSLGFSAKGYNHEIWIIGASYLSLGDPARWPYYWYEDGGAGPLLVGRGGMGAQHGISDFKDALKYGTPRILVWDSVTGNNPDSLYAISPVFYENTLEMLKICKEKGIKVYIQTMPNAIERTNAYKNDLIKNHRGEFSKYDYEVIDLAHAVDADSGKYSSWFEGMLYTDKVHPTRLGGRASYLGIIVDCPELILGRVCDIYSADAQSLSAGETLSVSESGNTDECAITFRADFDSFGKLTVGSEDGSRVEIDGEDVKVYSEKSELTFEAKTPAILKKLVSLKIKVKDGKGYIAFMSAGEKNFDPAKIKLDTFVADWNANGKVYATASDMALSGVHLKLAK